MGARQGTPRLARGRLAVAALLTVLACMAAPGVASAGTVGLNGTQMDFTADDGQANTITVTGGGGQITVRDAGHDVLLLPFTDADEKCTHPTTDSATCPAASVDVEGADLDDTIDASAATITVPDSIGAVFLNGGEGADHLIGGASVDTLSGDSGADTLDGGAGNDFITGGDGDDTIAGGPGNDSLEVVAFSTLGNDTIDGGEGDAPWCSRVAGRPG